MRRTANRQQRPCAQLLRRGAASLSEAELLAVVFQGGTPLHTARETAEQLLQHFGGLRAVLDAEPGQLGSRTGIGNARAAALKALPELAKRYF